MSIGNTRTGEGFRSRGVVRFVSRRKARSGRSDQDFKEFAQTAERRGRSGLVMIGRYWRGMERLSENSAPGVKREQRQNRIGRRSFANHYAAGKAKAALLGIEELGHCLTRYSPPGIELGRSNRVFFRSLNSSSAISVGSHRNRLSIKFSP
jgi:hypothetical protein